MKKELAYTFPLRADESAWLLLPADLTSKEAERLGAFLRTLVVVDGDAQSLYNELYDAFMNETAIEACDDLRARYPQYEARRPQ